MKHIFAIHTFFLLLILVAVSSCQQRKNVPIPTNPSGFSPIKTEIFEIPAGKKLTWKDIPKDSIPEAHTISFDFDKLPSESFSIHNFKPLKNKPEKIKFDFEDLDELKIDLSSISSKQIKVQKIHLPEARITKLAGLSKSDLTTAGILRIGQTEGLIGNSVFAMVADEQGNVWIATEQGLSKFTGDQFENYNLTPRNADGLVDSIIDLEIGKDGSLMILATYSGFYHLDMNSGILDNYSIGTDFFRFFEDESGSIWLGNVNKGLFLLNLEKQSIQNFDDLFSEDKKGVIGVFIDSKDNLWVGAIGQLAILNPARDAFRIIRNKDGIKGSHLYYEFAEDMEGKVWASSLEGDPISVSFQDGEIEYLGAKQGFYGGAKSVAIDQLGQVWIGTNDSLTIYNPKRQELKKIFTGAFIRSAGFPAPSMCDSKGNIWLGTVTSGIMLIDPSGMLSEHFNSSSGLASNEVWGIDESSDGKIWMATYRGVNIYDPIKETISLLTFPPQFSTNDFRSISSISDEEMLVGGFNGFVIINTVKETAEVFSTKGYITWKGLKDQKGNYWIGSQDGVFRFNHDKSEVKMITAQSGLTSSRVWLIEEDKEGRIWLGNELGVDILNKEQTETSYINRKAGLTSNNLSMLLQTKAGNMIVGGDDGISIIDLDKHTVTNISELNGLNPPALYDMIEVDEGNIQIGSENGIIVVDRPSQVEGDSLWYFYNYGKREGFPFNDYNQATAKFTSQGIAWWGAAPIVTVNLQEPKINKSLPKVRITSFTVMDQPASSLVVDPNYNTISVNDTIWDVERLEFYTKSTLSGDSNAVQKKALSMDSISHISRIPYGLVLPYDENSLNFSFINPEIQSRDKIIYRYILQGKDKSWSPASGQNSTKNYYNLLPGEYRFEVITQGFNGRWSEPASVYFTIAPPWWQTWWAYCLFAVILAAVIYSIVRIRSHYLEKENRILEERVLHRTEQLKNSIDKLKNAQTQLVQSEKMASLGELTAGIAHEIQNPLNFVNNFSELSNELFDEMKAEIDAGDYSEAKSICNDIQQNMEKITTHGKRADAIVKAMLQHSRTSSSNWSLTDINNLADEYLRLAYHGLRAKDKSFNVTMDTNFDPEVGQLNVMAQDLGRVFLNLINNAFYSVNEKKHQQLEYVPKVSVSTHKVGKKIWIKVKDNGYGIPAIVKDKIFQPFFTTKPTGQGTGLGLSISYDIVKVHSGELQVESTEGEGTEFTIILPVDIPNHEQ